MAVQQGRRCTVKGRVVYNRKPHIAQPKDGKRLFVAGCENLTNAIDLIDIPALIADMVIAYFEAAGRLLTIEEIPDILEELVTRLFNDAEIKFPDLSFFPTKPVTRFTEEEIEEFERGFEDGQVLE